MRDARKSWILLVLAAVAMLSSTPLAPGEAPGGSAAADLSIIADKRQAFKPDDVDGRLELARWCRDRELWTPMRELAHEALTIDAECRAAYQLLQTYDQHVPLDENKGQADKLQTEFKDRFGRDFHTRFTRHFVVIYDTTEAFTNQRAGALERAYDSFLFWFNMKKLRPEFLKERLVVILLKNRDDYLSYAKAVDGADLGWSAGYYSQRTNRATFFDDSTAPAEEDVQKKIDQLKAIAKDLSAQIDTARKTGQTATASSLTAKRNTLNQQILMVTNKVDIAVNQINTIKTVHEACHQLAFNTGIQKRLVEYPLWLSEGLACAFEVEDRNGARGPGILNYGRLNVIKTALKNTDTNGLLPLETIIGGSKPSYTDHDLAMFYAEGWALFHYLYKFERPGLEKYLTAFQQLRPLRVLDKDQQIKLFKDAFGDDLDGLEKKWQKYLKDLPNKAP